MSGSDKRREADDVGELIKLAGPRAAVSPERFQRAKARVQEHWRETVEEQAPKPKWYTPVALAASVLVGMGALLLVWQSGEISPGPAMARVERVVGGVTISGVPADLGTSIQYETTIRTAADGRLALHLPGRQSLRIGGDTLLVLTAPEEVALDKGALYLDSDPGIDAGAVTIRTPFGVARDVGTQFQVRVDAAALIVGVREGLVEVERSGRDQLSVPAGEFLELSLSGDEKRDEVSGTDPRWDWAEEVAPEFHIQDATLKEFLAWYTRERGLRLLWHDSRSEQNAQETRLHGSIAGLSLDEALQAVERIAVFDYEIEGDALRVNVQ